MRIFFSGSFLSFYGKEKIRWIFSGNINHRSGIKTEIDSYGVDQSGFTAQDELQYQTLRPILMSVMDFSFMAAGVKVQPDV